MAEQQLQTAQIGASLNHMRGVAMSQHVRRYPFVDPRPQRRERERLLEGRYVDRASWRGAWEKIGPRRSALLPILAEGFK